MMRRKKRTMSNVALDRAIAKLLFKRRIIGSTTCVNPPDDTWGAYPGTRLSRWTCQAEIRPVTLNKCSCKWNDRWNAKYHIRKPKFKGHYGMCLDVVPPYSEEWEYAREVLDWLLERRHVVVIRAEGHGKRMNFAVFVDSAPPCCADSPEKALVLATLSLVKKRTS